MSWEDWHRLLKESEIKASPDIYREWADTYDTFRVSSNSKGAESIATIWKRYHGDQLKHYKIFDAGCGTGGVGEEMFKLLGRTHLIEIYGGDLSPDMLEKAKPKNIYADLKVVNLKEQLPYEPEFFDSIISSGTFIPGHCGPECIPNIIRVLKRNCYFITTVRAKLYEETKPEWEQQIKECGCELVEEILDIKYNDLFKGFALVIKKSDTYIE